MKSSSDEINLLIRFKKTLAPITETSFTSGRLGLSFRGHRDDSKHHPKVDEYSSGELGNLVECLELNVRRRDKILEQHIQKRSKN